METTLAVWRKSSYSGSETNCVEAALSPGEVTVRDSKHPHHLHLGFDPSAWTAFLHDLKTGVHRL